MTPPAPQSSPEPYHWRHAVIVVPLITGGLFALAAVSRALTLPWWYASLAVAVMSAVALFAVAVITGNLWSITHSVATGIVATGWTVYATAAGPWSAPAAFALVIGALLLGPLYPVVVGHHRAAQAEARRRAARLAQEEDSRRWAEDFARFGAKGVAVLSSTETRSGHVYRLRLPTTGRVKFKKLLDVAEAIEIARSLRDGAVRFERGDHAGEVLMHVSEKDMLAELSPYDTGDLSDLTVNRPFRIGVNEDGTERLILLREVATLIVGVRGSGKSNLINVLIAQLGRCVDVVVFMIDLKGGRAALPWLQPWFDGKAPRPVIDWVATTRDEAERMLGALLRGVDARSHSGSGGEKITPTGREPAVVLIVDEMAVIFGSHGPQRAGDGASNTQLADLGTTFTQLGRSEAMDPVLATQRGTVTMTGGGDLKSQCLLRVGLGVATEADARLIVPDDAQVARLLPKMKHQGAGVVSDHDAIGPMKVDRVEPRDIYAIAAELGDRRPAPELLLTEAFGADYEQRWTMQRAGHIPGFRRMMAAAGKLGDADDATIRHEFASMMTGAGMADPALDDEDDRRNPDRERMVEIVQGAGVMGITPRTLGAKLSAEGISVARGTIQRWLTEEAQGEAPRLESATYGRWRRARPKTGAA